MKMHLCLGAPGEPCGIFTSAKSGRCSHHETLHNAARHDRTLDTHEWRSLAMNTVAAYIAKYGNVCPGWGIPAHPATHDNPLTADHIISRAQRPDLALDPRNIGVLCLQCNGRKAAQSAPAQGAAHV